MKRWSIVALLLLVAGSSATAVYFYRENLALRRQLASQMAPAPEAAKAPTAGTQVASATTPSEEDANPDAGAGDRTNAQNRAQRGQQRNNRGAEAMSRVLTDPEMREAMLTRNKAQVDRTFGSLFLKLGLGEDQTEMLRTLLAERQMARMEGGLMQRTATDDASKDQAKTWRESQAKSIDAGIASILGPDGSKLLEDYQRTAPQRQAVDEINRRASYAGAPLAADASDKLVQVIAAAQETVPVPNELVRPNWQGRGPGQQQGDQGGGQQQQQRQPLTQDAVNQYVSAQQAQNEQILASAKSFLTQAQLEALAGQQLDQLEQTQAQLNFRLKNPDMRMDVGGPGGFGGPGGGGFGGPGAFGNGGGARRNGGNRGNANNANANAAPGGG